MEDCRWQMTEGFGGQFQVELFFKRKVRSHQRIVNLNGAQSSRNPQKCVRRFLQQLRAAWREETGSRAVREPGMDSVQAGRSEWQEKDWQWGPRRARGSVA